MTFSSGNFGPNTFSTLGDAARKEATKKGTAYMNVWMYAIREFEDAIDDCTSCTSECNEFSVNSGSVHAWDEGVAFYTGTLLDGNKEAYHQMLVEHAARRVEEANLKAMEDDAARNHLVGVTTTAAAAHTAAGVGGIEVGGDNATPAELVMSREDRKIMAQVVLGNGQSVEGAAGIDGN